MDVLLRTRIVKLCAGTNRSRFNNHCEGMSIASVFLFSEISGHANRCIFDGWALSEMLNWDKDSEQSCWSTSFNEGSVGSNGSIGLEDRLRVSIDGADKRMGTISFRQFEIKLELKSSDCRPFRESWSISSEANRLIIIP